VEWSSLNLLAAAWTLPCLATSRNIFRSSHFAEFGFIGCLLLSPLKAYNK